MHPSGPTANVFPMQFTKVQTLPLRVKTQRQRSFMFITSIVPIFSRDFVKQENEKVAILFRLEGPLFRIF